jgi:hypothetical protein
VLITLVAVAAQLVELILVFQETVEQVVMDYVLLDTLKIQHKQLVDLFLILGQKQFMLSQEIVE